MVSRRGSLAVGFGIETSGLLKLLYWVLNAWSNADFLISKIKNSWIANMLAGWGPWLDIVLILLGILVIFVSWPRSQKEAGRSNSINSVAAKFDARQVAGNVTQVGGDLILSAPADTADRDRLARRWRQLAPRIDELIGAGRVIQEEMRTEVDRRGTLDAYVRRLENKEIGWRPQVAGFLDTEFPNTGLRQQILAKAARRPGLDPFEWELERLGITIAELTRLKEHDRMTHFIHMSGKYD